MPQRAKKLALVRGERTLVVGVDIAKRKHWACVVDGFTELPVSGPFPFQNSRDGFNRLLGQIARAKEKTGATRVMVGMEPTGHYWKPLAWYLRQADLTVVIVNHQERPEGHVGHRPAGPPGPFLRAVSP